MPEHPSGTVAFLFTDIEASTRLWETRQEAMADAVQQHVHLLDEVITAQNGVLFKTVGDGVQAAFHTVPHAVSAAIAAQLALQKHDWGDLGPLRVRMALHAGDATPQHGDYLAPVLNRLARLLAAGSGEQILLTDTARALATPLPVGYTLRDLGLHRLRDLLEAQRVFQVSGAGLPADFPPLKSLDTLPNNLPAQPTALFGRERELASLREILAAAETRLVTLVGPGGTGKTRLALQVAADVLEQYPDGVWWISLASVADPDLVLSTISAALGVRESAGEPLAATLAAHLRSRRMLLLLDNFEQVVAAATVVRDLLDRASLLVVLTTSREPLRLRAEREFHVAPLPVPSTGTRVSVEEALASPAVRLFVERAQAVKPAFMLESGNVADVVAICQHLDGLPLAIELAAARVRLLLPSALLARLDRRLAILTGGARDLPARQQTLRAAIAWSYDLLNPAERELFVRCAVFVGGFTFEVLDAVGNAAGGLSLDLLDGLDSLVQKSLMRQAEGPLAESRFTMLETIREFALERLQELPLGEALRQAHADAFLALAESVDWNDFGRQADLLNQLDADHANLRQAIGFYERQGAVGLGQLVRLAAALTDFWRLRGHFAEGRSVLERAIAARGEVPPDDCADAIFGAAFMAEAQGDLERAQALQEEVLALYQASRDMDGEARALTELGEMARKRGALDTARSRLRAALDVWRRAGDAAGTAGALIGLGFVRQLTGDFAGAEQDYQEGLRLFETVHDESGEAYTLNHLGLLAMATGDLPKAIERFEASLSRWRSLGNQQMIAADLHNLGEAHHLSGSLDGAERLYREGLALFEALGDSNGRGFALCQLGLLALDCNRPIEARDLLRESLRLRWSAGLRGSSADTLEALAEANWRLDDPTLAWTLLEAARQLREETGVTLQPVYEARHQRIVQAVQALVGPADSAAPRDLSALVAKLIGTDQSAMVQRG
jgi:predicted ATPase